MFICLIHWIYDHGYTTLHVDLVTSKQTYIQIHIAIPNQRVIKEKHEDWDIVIVVVPGERHYHASFLSSLRLQAMGKLKVKLIVTITQRLSSSRRLPWSEA